MVPNQLSTQGPPTFLSESRLVGFKQLLGGLSQLLTSEILKNILYLFRNNCEQSVWIDSFMKEIENSEIKFLME